MSVKDSNLVINIQDGLKGDIVDTIAFEKFVYDDDLFISTHITFGEYLLYNSIRKLLNDKKDIIIKLGYKD